MFEILGEKAKIAFAQFIPGLAIRRGKIPKRARRNSESNIKRAFICNVFPDGNKGGAAITAATVELVKQILPDAHLTLITTQVQGQSIENTHRFTKERYPDISLVRPLFEPRKGFLGGLRAVLTSIFVLVFPRAKPHELIQQIGEASLVISKGGYVYVERESLGGLMSLWLTAYPLLVASRLGVPTAIVCSTIGPYKTYYSRALNRYILRKITLIIPRDERSHREALALDVDPNRVRLLPDIVLGQRPPSGNGASTISKYVHAESHSYAVLSIKKGSNDGVFLPNLQRVLDSILERKWVNRFYVLIQSDEDIPISQEFVKLSANDRISLLNYDFSPLELMTIYSGAKFVIARRMHSAIFSFIVDTPAFVFAMEGKKVEGVIELLNLPSYLIPYPVFDQAVFLNRVKNVLEDEFAARAEIRSSVEKSRERLTDLPNLVASILQSPSAYRRIDET